MHRTRPPVRRHAVAAALLALYAATPARAEDAPATADTVVVTGQGRLQELQSVPIAIQVLGAEQVGKLAAQNLGDIASHVPGLAVDATQPTQPVMSLRGIGTSDFGIGTDSPVGVYVDGVYTGKTGGALLNFNDLKRIEVLKGPQGTLFGRNSAGGAIAVVTNDPEGTRKAQGLVRLGNEGLVHVEALVNQPLGEDLALRISAVSQHSDGFLKDSAGRLAGGDNAWGLRAALRWQASEDTKAVLSFEHEALDQRARPGVGVAAQPAGGGAPAFPLDPAHFVDPRKAPLASDVNNDRETRDFNGASLRITHAMDGATFSSSTAYRHFGSANRQDNDGSANPAIYLSTTNLESNTSVQQEFRLSGQHGSTDWLLGLSLYQEQARQSSLVDVTTDTLDTLGTNLAGLPLFGTVNQLAALAGVPDINLSGQGWSEAMHNEGRFRALAMYGDVIWTLAPQTRLTTGLRLTRDDKRFSWYNPPRSAPGLDAQLAVLDAAQLFPAMVAGGVLTADQAAAMQAGLHDNALIATSGATNAALELSRSWTDLSPRLVLDHQLDRNHMVYGSITRGYQAGGFNTLQVNSVYQPERVTSVELGVKGQAPQQGFSYSASVFAYQFNNLQTLQLVPSSGSGIPSYQVTISDQHATGADLSARWSASPLLQFYGELEWLDQTYRRGTSSAGNSLAGQPVGAPRLQASAGTEVGVPLQGGRASFGLAASYTGATRCNEETVAQGLCLTTPTFTVGGSRQRWDARAGWSDSADTVSLALVVNNLLDQRNINRISYEAEGLGSAYATLSRPRSVAVELKARF